MLLVTSNAYAENRYSYDSYNDDNSYKKASKKSYRSKYTPTNYRSRYDNNKTNHSPKQYNRYNRYDDYAAAYKLERLQKKIERKIRKGIYRGELDRYESKRLSRWQYKIEKMERSFKRDGYLSQSEAKILFKKIDRLSDKVYDYRHNDKASKKYSYSRYSR